MGVVAEVSERGHWRPEKPDLGCVFHVDAEVIRNDSDLFVVRKMVISKLNSESP